MRPAIAIALLALILTGIAPARAQEKAQEKDSGEFYNPYKAEKAVEVGIHYLKRKNYDAAIDRFLEAIQHKSNHAKAHRLLGEAFEKKSELGEAIAYYEKYLEILPAAEDAEKIRKRIEKLKKKQERNTRRKSS